jgi:predicted ester cyclase
MPTFRDAAARSRRSQGAFLDIPPTGRTVEYASIEIYRTADGKLAEE